MLFSGAMWGDPEERQQKKIYRIGKNAAYAIGGGLGIWGLKLFFPHPEGSERLSAAFGSIATLLIIYGIVMLALLVIRPSLAPKINFLFIALIIPACLFYIFVNNWHG